MVEHTMILTSLCCLSKKRRSFDRRLGGDEATALIIDEQGARMVGSGSVFRIYAIYFQSSLQAEHPSIGLRCMWKSIEDSNVHEWQIIDGELIPKEYTDANLRGLKSIQYANGHVCSFISRGYQCLICI